MTRTETIVRCLVCGKGLKGGKGSDVAIGAPSAEPPKVHRAHSTCAAKLVAKGMATRVGVGCGCVR